MNKTSQHSQLLVERFKTIVKELLIQQPAGISEFELLKELEERISDKNSSFFASSLSLFENHFILFHVLYQLQEEFIQSGSGFISISPLKILITPLSTKSTDPSVNNQHSITENDDGKLREYYLDLSNLVNETEESVNNLLNKFWDKYLAGDQREQALKELDLTDPVSYDEIKKRYRKLAMNHHPDRGGDIKKLQRINEAIEVLSRYYNR